MRSMFDMGFRNKFLGQDSGITTSYDQGPAAQPVQGIVTGLDQTSQDQGYQSQQIQPTPYQPYPSQQIQPTPAPAAASSGGSSGGTDWSKVAGQLLSAGAAGFGAYAKLQTTKIQSQTTPSSISSLLPAGLTPSPTATALLIGGGLIVVGVIGFVLLKPAPAPAPAA